MLNKLLNMIIWPRYNNILKVLFLFLALYTLKSVADENLLDVEEKGADQKVGDQPVTEQAKEQGEALETVGADRRDLNAEEKSAKSKFEESEPVGNENNQNSKSNENENNIRDEKQQQSQRAEGNEQSQLPVCDLNNEKSVKSNLNLENPVDGIAASDSSCSKKQTSNEEDINRKTSLSDVNSYTIDEVHEKAAKRETRYDYLGLPRDYSYFFDDLEPFTNNNSNNEQQSGRPGRAAPFKESNSQKSKLNGKIKESSMDNELEDDEDEEVNEDESEVKNNEDEYDDDEDVDSNCQTSPDCTTSKCTTTCPTTKCTPTPTSECPTPPKCPAPTQPPCPVKCRTTTEPTRCPRICAKGSKQKKNGPNNNY